MPATVEIEPSGEVVYRQVFQNISEIDIDRRRIGSSHRSLVWMICLT